MKKITFLLLFFIALAAKSQTVYPGYIDGQIYLKLRSPLPASVMSQKTRHIDPSAIKELKDYISRFGITSVSRPYAAASDDQLLPQVLRIEFSNKLQTSLLLEELSRQRFTEYAEKIPLCTTDATPNEGIPTHLAQINAANAWNIFNGNSNITVAIVDNAVMWTHADLMQNTYTNTAEIANNNTDDDNNGYVDDVNGWDVADWDNNTVPSQLGMNHGTHCAGIAAGRTDNNIGIASIGWNVKFIPVKCEYNNGSSTAVTYGFEGILYAAKARARVISCSWGSSGSSVTEQAVIDYAWNRGSIVMASASNNNVSTQSYPGAYANVYCVGAVDPADVKSSYSNYGSWVDICAPGDNINSTIPYTGTPAYISYSGTSMATPMVAGLAALMLSKSPNMTRQNVLNCISSTAVNIYTLAGNSAYSAGSQLGAGRIDAYAAMLCASTYSALPPVANFYAFPLNTCPNTNVQFNDSSLYAPTSWNWAFQGATPATSTSSAPVVQWTTPGTYSVMLTVSNASGSNTATKLSYITVSNAQPLPFFEGFQNSTFLPGGWTANNIWNDNIYWSRVTGLGGFGTSTACAKFDNYTYNAANERDEMRSPKFDMSNVAVAHLRFDVAYARYDATYSDSLEVKLSTNCGASWSTIYIKGGSTLATAPDASSLFVPTSIQWRRDSIDISGLVAGQGNVMFSFINRGHFGQPVYLDNINLFFPTPTITTTFPGTVCVNSPVSLVNTTSGATQYTWTMQGASPNTATVVSPTVVYATAGTYTINVSGINGTSTGSSTRTITVSSPPVLSTTGATICSGTSATVSATGASSYTWAATQGTFANGSSAVVTPTGDVTYTLSGSNGVCTASALVSVSVMPSPTISVNNASICSGGNATLIASGANSYSLNGNPSASTMIVNNLLTGTHIFTITGSAQNCNGSKTATVFVWPVPTITAVANNASVCPGSTVSINASGASSYTWNTGATTPGIVQSITTNTVFTVSGSNGSCSSTASVPITVVSLPTLVLNPAGNQTLCAGSSLSLSVSGASSYSWSNNSTINTATYNITGNTIINVTGYNGACSSSSSIGISIYPLFTVNISPFTSSVCAGQTAVLNATGASSYSWSNGGGGASLSLTPTQNTTVTVTGYSNNCPAQASTTIIVFQAPVTTKIVLPLTCAGGCNGGYTLTNISGASPFTFSGNGCNAPVCGSLCAGIYTLMTIDANNCKTTDTFTFTNPPAITGTVIPSNPSCGNCADGSLTVQAVGGTAPYAYNWSPVAGNTATLSGLQNGCYTVTITDVEQCSSQLTKCLSTLTGLSAASIENKVRVYPNPAITKVYIESDLNSLKIELFNSLGQMILSEHVQEKSKTLDLSLLARGVYFIQLSSATEKTWQKLILE